MDALEQLQLDFKEGRADLPRLFSFLADCLRQLQETQTQLQTSQARLQETQQQLKAAQARIEELEKKLGGPPTSRTE
jgi:peptidoglycan hydrolase CwlO-like protein